MAETNSIRVCVVYSPKARQMHEIELTLPPGSTVLQALGASGLAHIDPDIDLAHLSVSVWGHKAGPSRVLRDQDRVELCRALQVDPKWARRERFVKQGARSAGLFARRRPGAKPGY